MNSKQRAQARGRALRTFPVGSIVVGPDSKPGTVLGVEHAGAGLYVRLRNGHRRVWRVAQCSTV